MEQEKNPYITNVALIVGVTGMAGLSLAEALKSPTALGSPWQVYGMAWLDALSRLGCPPPLSTNTSLSMPQTPTTLMSHDKLAHIANKVTPCLLGSHPISASQLSHIALQTGTQHMGPIRDPTHLAQLIPREPPFLEDSPRLLYPNFYYALEDLVASYAPSLTYSVHRAFIIIGASSRSVYNALLTLAVYAIICQHEGLTFRFSDTHYTWEHFCDMSEARVLAEQHIWKSLWKVLSEIFDVEFVPFDEAEEFDFVGFMKAKGKVWDEIVVKCGLYKTQIDETYCFATVNNVLHLGVQHVCSMNKSREFGFFWACRHTKEY
ncbi:iridoid synthase CYC2-like [Fagus crenata]